MLKFGEAVRQTFELWGDFEGRSRRSEYWWFALFTFLVSLGAAALENVFFTSFSRTWEPPNGLFDAYMMQWRHYPLTMLVGYIFLVPLVSQGMRRLHDVGRRGWPVIAFFVSLELLGFLPTAMTPDAAGMNLIIAVSIIASLSAVVFGIYNFVFALVDSHKNTNEYGPSPKYGGVESVFD